MTARPLIHRSPILLGDQWDHDHPAFAGGFAAHRGLAAQGALAGPELWTENNFRTWAASATVPAAPGGAVQLIFGVTLAWVLVRYRFAGRRLIDAAVDLPFALPTAVAGSR